MEANLENKQYVTNVDGGQNCKAKTSLNRPRSGICDISNRLDFMFSWSFSLLS